MPSVSTENYLKSVYDLEQTTTPVPMSALADRLGVAPASVTEMVQKLDRARPRLLVYRPRKGVHLTDAGRQRALKVIRNHRLVEHFLHKVLGFSWDEVHEEAETLEHHLSDRVTERLAAFMGDPQYDPHGEPIPKQSGEIPTHADKVLSDLAEGETARIRRVGAKDPELLRHLAELGLIPGSEVTILSKAPFDGPIRIRIGSAEGGAVHGVGRGVTDQVFVASPGSCSKIYI